MRYVEYELKVDALRKLRKDRLQLVKQTTSDFAQVAHVFFIFERGVRKFQVGGKEAGSVYLVFLHGAVVRLPAGLIKTSALLHERRVFVC